MRQDNDTKGLTIALIGALVIVPDTMFMRISGLDGAQMVAWRGLLQASILIALWGITSRTYRSDLVALFSVGGFLTVVLSAMNAGLFAAGIALAPVAFVLLAVATTPLISVILGAVFLNDRIARETIIASVLVLGGIGLSVSGEGVEGSAVLGTICGLVVAVSLAGTFTLYRARDDLHVMLTVGAGGALAGSVGWLIAGPLTQTEGYLPAIWVTGLLILPVSFTCFNMASRYTVAANVSLLLLLETVLGPLVVWWVIGEAVGPRGLLGGAIVVLTLAIYLWNQRRLALRSLSSSPDTAA